MRIQLENINNFLLDYPVKDTSCSHDILTDYQEISIPYDGSFGKISHTQFKTKDINEIFLGSAPYNASDLCKCKICGKLSFIYSYSIIHQVVAEKVEIDFSKTYLNEPASKRVFLKKNAIKLFVEKFKFHELNEPESIEKISEIKIIEKNTIYIYNYSEEDNHIIFSIIANRSLLKSIYEFEKLNN